MFDWPGVARKRFSLFADAEHPWDLRACVLFTTAGKVVCNSKCALATEKQKQNEQKLVKPAVNFQKF